MSEQPENPVTRTKNNMAENIPELRDLDALMIFSMEQK
jgi:hypothetical protein